MARLSHKTGAGSSKCASCVRQGRDWAWGSPTLVIAAWFPYKQWAVRHGCICKAHVIGRWLTDCNSLGYKTNWETPLTELGCIPHNYTKDHENTLLFSCCISALKSYFHHVLQSKQCISVDWSQNQRCESPSTKLRGFVNMRNHVILLTVILNCMYICMCVYIYDMYIHSV